MSDIGHGMSGNITNTLSAHSKCRCCEGLHLWEGANTSKARQGIVAEGIPCRRNVSSAAVVATMSCLDWARLPPAAAAAAGTF